LLAALTDWVPLVPESKKGDYISYMIAMKTRADPPATAPIVAIGEFDCWAIFTKKDFYPPSGCRTASWKAR
jgi:hypothetical protein